MTPPRRVRVRAMTLHSVDRVVLALVVLLAATSLAVRPALDAAWPALPLSDAFDAAPLWGEDPFGERWARRPGVAFDFSGQPYPVTVPFSRGPDRVAGTADDIDVIRGWRLRLYQRCRLVGATLTLCLAAFYALTRLVPPATSSSVEAGLSLALGLATLVPLWGAVYWDPVLLVAFQELFVETGLPLVSPDVSFAHWLALWAVTGVALWCLRRGLASYQGDLRAPKDPAPTSLGG